MARTSIALFLTVKILERKEVIKGEMDGENGERCKRADNAMRDNIKTLSLLFDRGEKDCSVTAYLHLTVNYSGVRRGLTQGSKPPKIS